MSHGTKRQKDKKNRNRPKVGEMGFKPSIQKKSYKPNPVEQSSKLF